jgi:hypothetical protein
MVTMAEAKWIRYVAKPPWPSSKTIVTVATNGVNRKSKAISFQGARNATQKISVRTGNAIATARYGLMA